MHCRHFLKVQTNKREKNWDYQRLIGFLETLQKSILPKCRRTGKGVEEPVIQLPLQCGTFCAQCTMTIIRNACARRSAEIWKQFPVHRRYKYSRECWVEGRSPVKSSNRDTCCYKRQWCALIEIISGRSLFDMEARHLEVGGICLVRKQGIG